MRGFIFTGGKGGGEVGRKNSLDQKQRTILEQWSFLDLLKDYNPFTPKYTCKYTRTNERTTYEWKQIHVSIEVYLDIKSGVSGRYHDDIDRVIDIVLLSVGFRRIRVICYKVDKMCDALFSKSKLCATNPIGRWSIKLLLRLRRDPSSFHYLFFFSQIKISHFQNIKKT